MEKIKLKLNSNQSLYLDLIRVLAAQFVLIGHSISFLYGVDTYHYLQEISVLIFFILSGFLISYTVKLKISKNKLFNFKEYFIDRFSRIYSGLIPSLIAILIIDYLHIHYFQVPYNIVAGYNLDIPTFISNLFMLQDYPKLNFGTFGTGRPLWTLAIEWWLYMSYGLIVFYFTKQFNANKIIYIVLSLVVPISYVFGFGGGLPMYWWGGVYNYDLFI